MATVSLIGLGKRFGDTDTLRDIDLIIADREFVVLVGPSGCGKSTLLRMIAGLEDITTGELLIDGQRVNDLPPAARDLAMVFQSYALYPHMTVAENMGFALRLAGVKPALRRQRVAEAARILRLESCLDRKPGNLSGGQRQRVAIGRAIVRQPRVFLFDEPLSNLDAALRGQMRVELMTLHEQLAATMIYVTHDQVEAMTMADRIVVLRAGRIEQIGAPMQLYRHPINMFVAGFLGAPAMNFLPCILQDSTTAVLPSGAILLLDRTGPVTPGPATIGLRAEDIAITPDGPLHATLRTVEHLGTHTLLHVALPDATPLVIQAAGDLQLAPHTNVSLAPTGRMHLFDADGIAV